MSTPAPSPKWKSRLLTAVGAAALAILVTLSGVTAPLDAWVYDRLVLGAAPAADPRIVVVDIDQKSLAELGRWPWSRRWWWRRDGRVSRGLRPAWRRGRR